MKKKLSKFKNYLLKLKRVSTLSKKEKYVWNDLINLLDDLKLNYSRNDAQKTIHLDMNLVEDMVVSFRFSLFGRYLTLGVLVIDEIDSDKIGDMLVLASHMNSILPLGSVLVNASKGYIEYYLEIDVCRLLLYPGEIYEGIYIHYEFTKEHIIPTFEKMNTTLDDPIFVFSEFVEKYQNKNTG
jgi:hypothetical protein